MTRRRWLLLAAILAQPALTGLAAAAGMPAGAPPPAGAASAAAAPSAPAAPSFSSDLVPILRTRCAVCHLTGEEAGNMSLVPDAAYESLVGVKSPTTGLVRVVPGKPDDSYLIMKLEGNHLARGGSGARMPFGAEPLTPDLIRLFRDWIAAGAPKN